MPPPTMPIWRRQKQSFVRRGELRGYTRPSSPALHRTVVLLSSDGINESSRPWLLGIELRSADPGDILAIPVGEQLWAYAGDLTRLYRAWIGDRLGSLNMATLARLDGALRAALDL